MDADSCGEFIRLAETDSVNIIRKLVRVFFQNPVESAAVGFINPHRQRVGNPVFLQIDHRFPHFVLFFHLGCNIHRLALADPLDLRQALRLFFDNPKRIRPESFHNPRRQRSADSFDRPGAEISLHPRRILWRREFERRNFKLTPIHRVLGKISLQLQNFSLFQRLKCANAGDLVACIQFKNGIAVPVVTINNVCYKSFQLCHCFLRCCYNIGCTAPPTTPTGILNTKGRP